MSRAGIARGKNTAGGRFRLNSQMKWEVTVKMKKWIVMMLTASMISLSATGCGGSNNAAPAAQPEAEAGDAEAEAAEPEAEAVESTTETVEAEAEEADTVEAEAVSEGAEE